MTKENWCYRCLLGPCEADAQRCEGLEGDLALLAGGNMTDHYDPRMTKRGGSVSIERAAGRELDLKEELDNQIEAENLYGPGELKQGLPPCQRVKRTF